MNQSGVIEIAQEDCIGCGLCCRDCPHHVLVLQAGKAIMTADQCLECGHCVAICPKDAITMNTYDKTEAKSYDRSTFGLNDQVLLNTIKFRRSIRHYKNKQVDQDIIKRIIEAGRFTPTGSNKQKVRYIVAQDDLAVLEDIALDVFRTWQRILNIVSKVIRLPYDVSAFKLKPGFFFHGAPTVIFVISNDVVDASLASMSMELMAESLGLGTLYVGFFAVAAKRSRKIRKKLNLHKKECVVTSLAIGYPDVAYQRTVPRKKADIEWR